MIPSVMRYVFFLALVVVNVLYFTQPDERFEAKPQLASREFIRCWGTKDDACRSEASVLAVAEKPSVTVAKLKYKVSYGFSKPASLKMLEK